MSPTIIIAAIGVLALVVLVILFNTLVGKRQMANNAWSDIDVQLKRRSDLVPQLVDTVKGYAAHERQLFEDIAERRAAAQGAGNDPAKRAAAEQALSKPVSRLIAVAEAYPELKANQNFLALQNELSETENKIEMARRFYNGATRELNTSVESFPANLFATLFGFAKRPFFEIDDLAAQPPKIDTGKS